MHLVEHHRIDRHDPRFAQIDVAAFASKNLYNAALYHMRQQSIRDHTVITYGDLDKLMQPTEQYKALPAIDNYLHAASRRIIDLLVAHHIGTLVIGKNVGWKQEVNLGKKTNQTFVFLPHARFIDMLTYKAHLVGITVVLAEESHTSKCSFLDDEPVGHHEQYVGQRIKRGLFRTATGQCINADVNGAYNIITKVVPDAFGKGRVGVVVHPVGLALRNRALAS